MNTIIPILPSETPAFARDPYRYLEEARKEHPWLARFAEGYVVHGYQESIDLLTDEKNLRIGYDMIIDFYGVRGSMWARFMNEMMLAVSGETHRLLRGSVAHAFTPKRAKRERESMRRVMNELLDKWAPAGNFDFAQFSAQFPVSVMCAILGISTDVLPQITAALDNHTKSLTFDPDAKPHFMAGWDVLWDFADRTVREHEASGERDPEALLSSLIEAKNAGHLDETNLRFMLILLLIAGYDTSKNQLSVAMNLLLDRPEIYERCARDTDYCRDIVEESMRYSSVVSNYRFALRDFTFGGVEFKEGDTIVMALPLSGRDPSVFPEPERFDPQRENARRHIAFGRGAHICLGQFIARYQLQEGLHLIAQRLKNPRRAGEVQWRPFLGVGGIKSLPIAFDPT
ncbi:MAG: cytochrome P450 [Sphingomonadaceae bacterium]|nr:cytochrome P450 [Sphingomonadaceae bacterium]